LWRRTGWIGLSIWETPCRTLAEAFSYNRAMPTGLIYHQQFLHHDTGPGHPERPHRLQAILALLEQTSLWSRLVHLPFAAADLAAVQRVHDPAYIQRVQATCKTGMPTIDRIDGGICPESYDIALLAAGGAVAAVEAVLRDDVTQAFCAIRPPGHHAERDLAMGFCLFNNIAIAAEHAVAAHGLTRIAIVDFDVHHGNGTQHTFEHRRDVLFISLHEHPRYQYPGTGFENEIGMGEGEGKTLNIPLIPGSDDAVYERAFIEKVLPALHSHEPELVLISAGFDAADSDPLGHMQLTPAAFASMTRHLRTVADRHCGGRIVSVLEGGYDLPALALGVEAHIRELME